MTSTSLLPIAARLLEPLCAYHDHRVEGIEHVPIQGPALIACHHSWATYDGFLLGLAIWHRTGRPVMGLAHDRFFDLQAVGSVAERLGMKRASPETGLALLKEGHLVLVAPGGMKEALRPSTEKYRVCWSGRKGFIRLVIRAQAPLILAACPGADDLFEVGPHPLTDWVYENLRLPLVRFRGRRGLPVPRKVPLVHYVAPPLRPPPVDEARFEAQVDALHEEAMGRMAGLLAGRYP